MKRRAFLTKAGAAAASLPMFRALGDYGPGGVRKGRIVGGDEKVRVAAVGCGGKGESDIGNVGDQNVVALCDVDFNRALNSIKRFPNAKRFKDFRQMLLEMDKEIDAVTVSTPDHMHYPAARMAIEMGKHVYVQKPLTHTVAEARELMLLARKHEVVSQMGNQGHAGEGTRLMKEWVQAGAIGQVRQVYVWTNRPIWPQGGKRPEGAKTPPETLDWNRWLGVAPERPYNDGYAPFAWRGWWDFGCGALGDMACHIMDAAYWALDLKYPDGFEAVQGGMTDEMAPNWSIVTYSFPARGSLPPVKLTWYEGKKDDGTPNIPPRPDCLEAGREMPRGGQMLVGEKGVIWDTSDYCQSPRLIPETKMQEFTKAGLPPKTLPRAPENNPHKEWIAGIKGQLPYKLPGSCFEHSCPLTETVLLGNLAIRTGRKIKWDPVKMECAGDPEATRLVRKMYRVY